MQKVIREKPNFGYRGECSANKITNISKKLIKQIIDYDKALIKDSIEEGLLDLDVLIDFDNLEFFISTNNARFEQEQLDQNRTKYTCTTDSGTVEFVIVREFPTFDFATNIYNPKIGIVRTDFKITKLR